MFYFAYGSNMLTARLARRVPSARPAGRAWLIGYRLDFNLRGDDGSGKCNVRYTGCDEDIVHGVLFQLDADRLDRLHAAEGPAYRFLELDLACEQGHRRAAIYYGCRDWLDDNLIAFEWYRAFVTAGAREHGLPRHYIRRLAAVPARRDPDRGRAACNARILDNRPDEAVGDA